MAYTKRGYVAGRWFAMLIAGSLILLTGCSSIEMYGFKGSESEMTEEEIATRPFLEDQIAIYDAMLEEVREAIKAEFPGGEWESSGNMVTINLNVGKNTASPAWVYGISIAQTSETKQRAADCTSAVIMKYGFIELIPFLDKEGNIQFVSDDQYGAKFDIGATKRTVMRYTTGDHLERNPS